MSLHSRLGLGILLVLLLVVVTSRLFHGQTSNTVFTDLGDVLSEQVNIPPQSKELQAMVDKRLKDQKGDFAVVIEDIQSGEQYHLNSQTAFPAGSFYKLVLMASVFKELAKGSLTKETILSASKDHLTAVFGEIDFGYQDFNSPITLSVEDALSRIAQVSDNFAAIMLTEKVRELNVGGSNEPLAQMAQDLELKHTHFGDPETTAEDTAHFFRLLYEGKVVSVEVSQQIINLLSQVQINDRIPALLPKDIGIAHKTAELPQLRHDAGIVFLPNNPYIIVLMSNNVDYEDDTVDLFANISKDVYDYFAKMR